MLQFDMGNTAGQKNWLYTGQPESELLPFRLMGFGDFDCDQSYFTRRSGLGEFLFLLTIGGDGLLEYEGQSLRLLPGEGVVIDCMPYHYYATGKSGRWHFVWMHFSGTAAAGYVRWLNSSSVRKLAVDARWLTEFCEQLQVFARQPGRFTDMTLSVWMHQFFNELVQEVSYARPKPYQQQILAVAAYMRSHLGQPLRMRELAAQCGLSEYYFQRIFKNILGHAPYEYLTILRVDGAKQLLASTDLPLALVAESVGYSDAKLLIENFRRHTGMTPARFRRDFRENAEPVVPPAAKIADE